MRIDGRCLAVDPARVHALTVATRRRACPGLARAAAREDARRKIVVDDEDSGLAASVSGSWHGANSLLASCGAISSSRARQGLDRMSACESHDPDCSDAGWRFVVFGASCRLRSVLPSERRPELYLHLEQHGLVRGDRTAGRAVEYVRLWWPRPQLLDEDRTARTAQSGTRLPAVRQRYPERQERAGGPERRASPAFNEHRPRADDRGRERQMPSLAAAFAAVGVNGATASSEGSCGTSQRGACAAARRRSSDL